MTVLLRIGVCAVLLGFGAACESLPPPAIPPASAPIDDSFLPVLEERIFARIADARCADRPDCHTLIRDAELTEIARLRSARMAKAGAFADTDGDPHVSASLLMARDAQFQGMVGENVAALPLPTDRPINVEAMAVRFAQGWLTSLAHRENLMFAAFDRSGVGAARVGDTVYVTQLFAAKLQIPTSGSAPRSQGPRVANPPHGKDDEADAQLRGTIPP